MQYLYLGNSVQAVRRILVLTKNLQQVLQLSQFALSVIVLSQGGCPNPRTYLHYSFQPPSVVFIQLLNKYTYQKQGTQQGRMSEDLGQDGTVRPPGFTALRVYEQHTIVTSNNSFKDLKFHKFDILKLLQAYLLA